MKQNYKIFVKQNPLFLTDNLDSFRDDKGALLIELKNGADVFDPVEYLEGDPIHDKVVFYGPSAEEQLSILSNVFHYIDAAGGLVFNKKGEVLVMVRNGIWDLPKGKIENSESLEKAAVREVKEECGIKKLEIKKKLLTTYHTYIQNDERVLKATHWYEMNCGDPQNIEPQEEEGISHLQWMNKEELEKIFEHTYANLHDLLQMAMDRM